jgi:redox-sensitive bicupin YhaK (pirin superfamily)
MTDDVIRQVVPLGFQWPAVDPFLFCVHHRDDYPAGNERLGPAASLEGRELGRDFAGKDGWRMYHGRVVPGFPAHPHRGFETITIVRGGVIDHSDSLGATARFGAGDVQWLTAGRGIVHAEMFPLLQPGARNPVELFQIWLNLPRADKLVQPHFTMLWREQIPTVTVRDAAGATTTITVIAGALGETRPPAPPPRSWAARPESAFALWSIAMAPNARWTLPAGPREAQRTLYVFAGGGARVAGRDVASGNGLVLRPDVDVTVENGAQASELLLMQARPIGEPVVAHGPFVMSSEAEIVQAFRDYERTRFGGWPWAKDDPVHAVEQARFARRSDGEVEHPREP